jgi:hypothetical protein
MPTLEGGFPDRVRVKLLYREIATAGTVTLRSQVWTGNGAFDPNVTGTGGQPYNYDDWAVQYTRVRCHGSSIQVRVLSLTSNSGTEMMCAPRHLSTAVTAATWSDFVVAPYAKSLTLPFAASQGALDHSMTTSKFLGQTDITGPDVLQSLTTANPSHLWYWHTSVTSADEAATGTISSIIQVVITYDLEFFDRLELTLDEKIDRMRFFESRRERKVRSPSVDDTIVVVEAPTAESATPPGRTGSVQAEQKQPSSLAKPPASGPLASVTAGLRDLRARARPP